MLRTITKTYSLKSFKRQNLYRYIIGCTVFLHLSIDYYLKYYKKKYITKMSLQDFQTFFRSTRFYILKQ